MSASTTDCVALDPCTLGRPFHRLSHFHGRLKAALEAYFVQRFNHRHGAAFSLGEAAMVSRRGDGMAGSWHNYQTSAGAVAVRVPRPLLLAMLGLHYGEKRPAGDIDAIPVTATEQRFSVATAAALIQVLAESAWPGAADGLIPNDGMTPLVCDRLMRVPVHEPDLQPASQVEYLVDDAWLGRLLAEAPERKRAVSASAGQLEPLAERLRITLNAELVGRAASLDEILRLSPGDIVPIRLPDSVDVLVRDTRLFSAVVAEQGGNLCLTSLQLANETA